MDPAAVRELARKGGLKAQELGVAHRFTTAEARVAGRKGGQARGRAVNTAPPPAERSEERIQDGSSPEEAASGDA